jgi:succinyl-CoA synthetase beta subunit
MRLHEYHCKQIFNQSGIPTPRGRVVMTPAEAELAAVELGGKVVVKAQVLVGGRGKAGGIRLAKTPAESGEVAALILQMKIKGLRVNKVLVDEMVSIAQELYIGISNDRSINQPVIMACSAGGVDIEEVARVSPEKIVKIPIDPWHGLRDYQSRTLALAIDLPNNQWRAFGEITRGLWQVFTKFDATLAEINPLVITTADSFVALDSKMIVDDNALFRHPELMDLPGFDAEDLGESEARKYELSYIRMDGNVGCMVNGAGLAMAVMDIIKQQGGSPANFLDIGGGANAEKTAAAMRILLSNQSVRAVLINIFGGITRCDQVARGILKAMDEIKPEVPLVIRLAGTNSEEGRLILKNAKIFTEENLVDAAVRAVDLARKGAE